MSSSDDTGDGGMSSSDDTGDGGMDMSVLSQRIAQLRSGQSSRAALPILVLDALLPRQRLTITMDDDAGRRLLRDCVDQFDSMLGVHGYDPRTKNILPTGTQVKVVVGEGGSTVTLIGQRRYSLCAQPRLEADTYYVCDVEWTERDKGDNDAVLVAEALGPLIARWKDLVRGGRERSVGQLDRILTDLGPMPPPADPDELALYVAALINPLPALGVAYEIRPAMLVAKSAAERLQIAKVGIEKSIGHLDGSQPLW
jgi:hypothetical protein